MKTSRLVLSIGVGATMLTAGWRAGTAAVPGAQDGFAFGAIEPSPSPSPSASPSPDPTTDPAAAPDTTKPQTKSTKTPKPKSTQKPTTTTTSAPKPTQKPTQKPPPSKPSGTFKGPAVSTRWGVMQVALVVKNGKITSVKPLRIGYGDSHSRSLNGRAVPTLQSRVVSAQSYKVSYVSGASYTSQGFLASVKGAMKKAGI